MDFLEEPVHLETEARLGQLVFQETLEAQAYRVPLVQMDFQEILAQ